MELMGSAAPNISRVSNHWAIVQAKAIKDGAVSPMHDLIGFLQ